LGKQHPPCVAFRLDDIQDYWITAGQEAVINVFASNHLPMTIGIIANYFGCDPDIVGFIQNIVSTQPQMEIASHGYNHEDFTTFSLNNQESLLRESIAKIHSLTNITVTTFVPPFNAWNSETVTAMTQNRITCFSSEEDLDDPPNAMDWPIGADTSFTDPTYTMYYSQSPGIVVGEINAQINRAGYAAIMMHPMEYHIWDSSINDYGALNQSAVNMLINVVGQVRAAGYTFTTLKGLASCVGTRPTGRPQCAVAQDCAGYFADSCIDMSCDSAVCNCNDC